MALWATSPDPYTLQQKTPKKQKNKTNKKKPNKKQKKKKKEAQKKTAKTPKNSFSVICQIFPFFWVAFQNFPFLTPWPKNLNPKNTIKLGVSGPFFWKADVRHETAILGPKKPKIYKFQLSFFCLFSSLSKTKNTKIC